MFRSSSVSSTLVCQRREQWKSNLSLDNKLQQLLALLELDRCVKTNGHPDSQIVELMIRSNLALTYLWSIVKD